MEESVKLDIFKEKSIFERAIIEAFKQNKVSDTYEKLLIAYEELSIYIDEIKKENEQEKKNNFVLNLNIIDKISRIIERNYININILISKIFNIFLKDENIPILSDNPTILINLSNKLITILEIIKSCDNYYELTRQSINYMKYLTNNSEKFLSDEQKDIINNLQSVLNGKIISSAYSNFKNNFQKEILTLCKGESALEKEQGLENLNTYFFKLNSLNEQFELLSQFGEEIIKAIISKPNPSLIDTYYKLSYFLISFIYNFNYKIKLSPYENNTVLDNDNENLTKINEQYYILDSMEENIELNENLYVTQYHGKEFHNLKFLEKTLYELGEVKNILLKYPKIFSLCVSFLNCLILFEESFKSQYACFLMLKRLYFIFPKKRNELEDLITTALINLLCFNEELVMESKEPYESFLIYLLENGEENIKQKLKDRLEKKKDIIKTDYLKIINKNKIEKINVESDIIYVSDFNLNIGCPSNIEIPAGDEEERLIEVKYPNSILYIGFNLPYYDINLHLIKYCPNINNSLSSKEKNEKKVEYEDYQYFYEIFKLERIQNAKIILFIKSPGIYKVLFDNKYSWFKSKSLRYRCTILKELNGFNLSPLTSNDEIKIEAENNDKNEKEENIINENKKDDIKEEENVEDKNDVKITVNSGESSSGLQDKDRDDEDLNDDEEDLK